MEIRPIKGFSWPRPEELRKIALTRTLNPDKLLALKSRSFYAPTQMLEFTRGNDETNKRGTVTVLYDILRYLDTIEDANPEKLNNHTKIGLMDNLYYILDQITRRSPSESIDDLIEHELAELTVQLQPGVMDDDERIFVEHFGRGGVLVDVKKYARGKTKRAILECARNMGTGMRRFLLNGEITTIDKLDEYCGYVAGDVGIALNQIIEEVDGAKLDDIRARIFGLSLQKINVSKNIHEDWDRRKVIYLPKEYIGSLSNKDLFDMDNSDAKSVRASVLERMLTNTKSDLRTSAEYIISIPQNLTGYLAFTMIPYFAAIETLQAIERGGAEEVFRGNEIATKMSSKAFSNITNFTYSLTTLDNGRRIREFMEMYKTAQESDKYDYSFEPGKFERWSKPLFEE